MTDSSKTCRKLNLMCVTCGCLILLMSRVQSFKTDELLTETTLPTESSDQETNSIFLGNSSSFLPFTDGTNGTSPTDLPMAETSDTTSGQNDAFNPYETVALKTESYLDNSPAVTMETPEIRNIWTTENTAETDSTFRELMSWVTQLEDTSTNDESSPDDAIATDGTDGSTDENDSEADGISTEITYTTSSETDGPNLPHGSTRQTEISSGMSSSIQTSLITDSYRSSAEMTSSKRNTEYFTRSSIGNTESLVTSMIPEMSFAEENNSLEFSSSTENLNYFPSSTTMRQQFTTAFPGTETAFTEQFTEENFSSVTTEIIPNQSFVSDATETMASPATTESEESSASKIPLTTPFERNPVTTDSSVQARATQPSSPDLTALNNVSAKYPSERSSSASLLIYSGSTTGEEIALMTSSSFSDPFNESSSSDQSSKLGGGQIAAIVVFSVIGGVTLIAGVIAYVIIRRRSTNEYNITESYEMMS